MGVEDGVDEPSCQWGKRSDDAVVPAGQKGFSIVSEDQTRTAEVCDSDAEELLHVVEVPDADAVLAGCCEHFGELTEREEVFNNFASIVLGIVY